MPNLKATARRHIVRKINIGDFRVGEFLPPVPNLAQDLDCSEGTIRNVLNELAREGIVKNTRRAGCRLLRKPPAGKLCVIPSYDGHVNGLVLEPVCTSLLEAGYDVDLLPSCLKSNFVYQQFQRLMQSSHVPDAAVVLSLEGGAHAGGPLLFEAVRRIGKCVGFCIDAPPELENTVIVQMDSWKAARIVADYLLGLGHRCVGVATGYVHEENQTASRIALLFKEMMERAGAVCHLHYIGEGEDKLLQLIKREGLTAFWCRLDIQALAVVSLCHGAGLRVPEDISIIGRYDTPLLGAQFTNVSLTPAGVAKAITEAVGRIIAGIDKPALVGVEPELVPRKTSGPAPVITIVPAKAQGTRPKPRSRPAKAKS